MSGMDTEECDALDIFLDELDKKARQDGYPPNVIRNIRHSPEMMDILIRMIGAELQAKNERVLRNSLTNR